MIIRWLRVSWPPLGWVALFAGVYAAALGLLHWVEWRLGGLLLDEEQRSMRMRITGGCLIAATIVYGLWRALVFHPRGRPGYAQWLAATP